MIKLILILFLATNAFAAGDSFTPEGVQTHNAVLNSQLDLTFSGIEATRGNDVWGWTDPQTGKEYAIMGLDNKASFVDISNPSKPIHLADLETRTYASTWRDIKIYKDHAYIVSEAYKHGLQVFDLTRLRGLSGSSVAEVTEDVHYKKFGSAHNIFINEDTGYGYVVGSSTCDGGLHIINIKNPKNPKFVNCVGRSVYELPRKDGQAYTHDVQCVVYAGEDSRYLGREICVAANEDSLNVVDVTDKANPIQISAASYDGVRYTHQGWFTEDHKYFLLGDELDEKKFGVRTKTFIWDFSDLHDIKHFATHTAKTRAIDHNMYVKGNYVYQANYGAGLRILALDDIDRGRLTEVAYVDTNPADKPDFNGVWSVFPYYASGTVAISGTNGVLYIATPNLP